MVTKAADLLEYLICSSVWKRTQYRLKKKFNLITNKNTCQNWQCVLRSEVEMGVTDNMSKKNLFLLLFIALLFFFFLTFSHRPLQSSVSLRCDMEHCLQAARSTLILYPLFLLFLSYCFGLPSRGSRHLQSYTNNSYHTPNWEQAAATTAAITATAAETEVATTAAAAQNSTIWKLINQSRSNGQLHTTPPLLNIGEQLNSSLPKKQNGFKWNYRKSFKDLYTALVLNDQAHGRKGSIVIFTDIGKLQ